MSWWWWWGSGGSVDPAQALLNGAAVRFDFSQYDDIDNMFDVNGGWGPAGPLGSSNATLTADGIQMTTNGVDVGTWTLGPGLVDFVPGPLIYGPDGLTLMSVAHLSDPLDETVVLSIQTRNLYANADDTQYPAGASTWAVTSDLGATFYDMEPSEDTIVDMFEDLSPGTALAAGAYIAVYRFDVPGQTLNVRLVAPGGSQDFSQPFTKAIPDFASDPQTIEDWISSSKLTFTGDPAVVSLVQVEWDGWNRSLSDAEVDALVAHFQA